MTREHQAPGGGAGHPGAVTFAEALDERIAGIVEACTRCGKCFEACPMRAPAGLADAEPAHVLAGVIDLLRGEPGNPSAARWVSACTSSGYCIRACDYGVNPRFMVKMASLAHKRRRAEPGAVEARAKATFKTMTRGVRMLSRLQLPPDALARVNPGPGRGGNADPPPEVVFYTGCNVLKTPHIALLCLDVLDRLEVRYEVRGGTSTCCGIFQFIEGDREASGRVAFGSIEQLERAGAAEVLSWCPSCQTQLGEVALPAYERAQGERPFALTPFLVYLGRHLERLRPLMVHRVERRVALNERPVLPEATAAVKAILRAIPGLELVELDVPRVGTMSNYLSVLPKFKTELREAEFRAAAAAGVTTLATVYHACHREICHLEPEVSFEIVNFMELLGESLGLSSPDVYKRLKLMQDVDAIIADSADLVARHELDLEALRDAIARDMFATQPVGMTAVE